MSKHLRKRLDRLEINGPSVTAIQAAMRALLEEGIAPEGPAGDFARHAILSLEVMESSVPASPNPG